MAEGGGMTTTPPETQPAKRGAGWRVWVAILIVLIVAIAGVAYYLTSSGGPKRDTGTITYYMQSEPLTFDSADAYDLWSFIAIQNTYDTLVGYTSDSLALTPNLATTWDTLDAQHYVFHLRQGVKFADGSNFTASDVYWSFYRVLKVAAPTTGVNWILAQDLDAANPSNSLWVKDRYTIQMNLTIPYSGFLQTLATVEPSAVMSASWIKAHGNSAYPGGIVPGQDNSFITNNTMGTGPYVLNQASWTRGSEMTLIRNEHYWRGWSGNHANKVVIKFTSDASSRVEAVRTKVADIADLPLTNVKDVSGVSGVVAKANATVKSEIITMNTTNAFMADDAPGRLVRQAFSWAFDYNGTISSAYAGFARLLPGPIPFGMDYFNVQSQVYYQKLAKASLLLNQSGHPIATSGPNAGYRFGGYAFRIVADGSQVEEATAAQIFRNTLGSLGIKSTLDIKATTKLWDAARTTAAYDFFVAHWVLDYLDADDYVSPMVMNSTNGGDYWHTGLNNFTMNYYGALARSDSGAARALDYSKVWIAAMNNPNMIWFCQQEYVPIYQSYVQGFFFNPVTWYNFYFYQKT
jgi:peptide/nickel transport system substrate-binding protein